MRSSKHEEAAKKQCAAGKKKEERTPQDLISVKFSSFIFCHNVRGETLFTVNFVLTILLQF